MAAPEVFPDSRLQTVATVKGAVWRGDAWWQPIFCASCGADGGLVPERHTTFAFYLCNPCARTYGPLTGTMVEPDAVFWERVKQEQLDTYGRFLTAAELEVVAGGTSSLSTLLREGS